MTSSAFVWVFLPGDAQPTLCGRFSHEVNAAGLALGKFVYGKSYLALPHAIPIDPIVLPLANREWTTTAQQGLFGVIDDAAPDSWGKYVVDRAYGKQASPVDYLLKSQQDRVGNLAFSAASNIQPVNSEPLDKAWLPDIYRVIADLELERPIPPELQAQIRANTGLGGARPKVSVTGTGFQWLAKFPSHKDSPRVPVARLEAAALDLAARCGITTVIHEVAPIQGADVLLVRRFDRTKLADGWGHDTFVSARTVFASDEAANQYSFFGSYPRLAIDMARWSSRPASDRTELFRRMVFNAVLGNGDDHDRNHGFLADEERPGAYRLSPAYDLVPSLNQPKIRHLALGVGDAGSVVTLENLLSGAASFGLDRNVAAAMIHTLGEQALDLWAACCQQQGLDQAVIAELASCVQAVPSA
jgi:serine/threonine-protein kinase HipA